jgi:hypothetical protein
MGAMSFESTMTLQLHRQKKNVLELVLKFIKSRWGPFPDTSTLSGTTGKLIKLQIMALTLIHDFYDKESILLVGLLYGASTDCIYELNVLVLF